MRPPAWPLAAIAVVALAFSACAGGAPGPAPVPAEREWRTHGGDPELTAKGIPPTGTENYGGPVVTAGGLLFIGATKDEKFRAFDKRTGKVLWETSLPAGGYATPATYEANGKQYVVIAAGGGKMGTKSGDAYVAFALPD